MAQGPTSPALSTSSLSSYDFVSARSRSTSMSSSAVLSSSVDEDVIVWSLSESESSRGVTPGPVATGEYDSDEDFVVLKPLDPVASLSPPPREREKSEPTAVDKPSEAASELGDTRHSSQTPIPTTDVLKAALENVEISRPPPLARVSDASTSRPSMRAVEKTPAAGNSEGLTSFGSQEPALQEAPCKSNPSAKATSTSIPPILVHAKSKSEAKRNAARKRKARAKKVQAASKGAAVKKAPKSVEYNPEEYKGLLEEASNYISAYLKNPEAKTNSVCKLTLLQSLLIELGLTRVASALPTSLRAATNILKSNVFINIKEYVSVRTQGPEAISKALYPNRSALKNAMKKKSNRAPLQWVKEHGLNVLLVTCFHH